MTSGGKIVLGLLALGGITLAVFHSGKAHAETLPPPPEPPEPLPPGGSVFPPAGTQIPGGGAVPVIPGITAPATAPLPRQIDPLPVPAASPGVVPLPASTSPFPAVTVPSTVDVPGLGPVTVPTVTPGPALPTTLPAPPSPDVAGSAPADTLALVKSMLATERNPRWRVSDPLLKAWQKSRGRVADGQFGTGDALTMAQEIGTIPIIRGWPKGSFLGDGKLDSYRASLQQIANSAPEPRASLLRASAARELGQGYGTPEKPIATLITIQT